MPDMAADNIRIEYETFGTPSSPALLLIMGLGTQMVFWHTDFCRQLASKGLYVIRFDNRDVGLSTKFFDAGVPDIIAAMADAASGKPINAPYSIDDMADDVAGLLNRLSIDKAHVCGASMGGMIAQTFAWRYPQRTLSLISIMSSTGDPGLPPGKPEALTALTRRVPDDREGYIRHSVNMWKTIGSPGFPFDEERLTQMTSQSYDRCFHPQGMARQLAAILAHGNRKRFLSAITAPTLVIHGSDDPLVPVEAGKDTAEAIPDARLLIINGMGHDFPPGAYVQLVEAIAAHTIGTCSG